MSPTGPGGGPVLPVQSARLETLAVLRDGPVVFVDIAAPPMNLIGPELVRDLVSLIQLSERDPGARVLVFRSADPEYFISHVDVRQIREYRQEAVPLIGEASLGLLFRYLSSSRLVTIAQVEGRARGAGSEFVLACDMQFAALESAVFGQFESALGAMPGGGAVQHLVRLMGRSRALEVLLSADDYDAASAERYGWITRAMPSAELGGFVRSLAHRIGHFPATAQATIKERVSLIALASVEDFRRDSDLFGEGMGQPEARARMSAALGSGFQTRSAELALGGLLGKLGGPSGAK